MNFANICIHCIKEKSTPGEVCSFCGFDPDTYQVPPQVLPPMTILDGKYLVGEVVGAGGFGITYAALYKHAANIRRPEKGGKETFQ